jgi:hypothetical protein
LIFSGTVNIPVFFIGIGILQAGQARVVAAFGDGLGEAGPANAAAASVPIKAADTVSPVIILFMMRFFLSKD